jgi:hypothetical protein
MSPRQMEAAALMVVALAGAAVLHRVAVKQGAVVGLTPAFVAIAGVVVSAGLVTGGARSST